MSLSQNIARAKTDYDEVYEAGRVQGQGDIWDGIQDYGNRTNYQRGFAKSGFTEITPKYPFTNILIVREMFSECPNLLRTPPISFAQGINVTFYNFCNNCTSLVEVDNIIIRPNSTQYMPSAFYGCINLKKVSSIEITNADFDNLTFYKCYALEELDITGTLSYNGLNLSWSKKLNKASITNIVNILSTTTNALAVTISETAVNNAFETSAGAADGSTSAEWEYLEGTRQNWHILLQDS